VIHQANPNSELPADQVSTRRELARAFNKWAEANGSSKMAERKIIDRLVGIEGVTEVRVSTAAPGVVGLLGA
jgi:hypothetical protein